MRNRTKPKMNDYQFIHIPKWKIQGFDDYYFTDDKKLFNKRTNRFSKKRVKTYSVGYTLNGVFYTLNKMKALTTLIGPVSFQVTNLNSVQKLYKYLQKAA
ncbi:hypothetical protein ACFQ5N_02235 [Lutibacter holmesii]|uniref:Uncharacterized protein n=1 Tax=Lutibacter holmesii TaxID=1137985 RepID=A0ABW3WLT8_9FLAO